jgi:pimeloyl-ACP methyl ester carboxylesterase
LEEITLKIKIKKIGKIALWIIGFIVGLIALAMLIGFILHNTYYKSQLDKIDPYGQMVDVGGKKMHVYSMGDGEETIILLPGHGVPLPSADFAPLMRKLSEKYRVAIVEYFGVGFSDNTDATRNCQNYMDEIRTALDKANIKPPYILMPHSISGIYSEYYATKHPEEIKGMILLDTTSTASIIDIPESEITLYKVARFQQNIGFQRLYLSLNPDALEANSNGFNMTIGNGYTQKEIDDFKKYLCYNMNETIIEQLENTMDCVKEVKQLPFPKDIPVLKIIAKDTIEGRNEDFENLHLNRLGDNSTAIILDGPHFIYHSQIEKISELTSEFIANLKN